MHIAVIGCGYWGPNHTFLFNPGIVKIKQLIDQDELGIVFSLSAVRTNLGPNRSDVNARKVRQMTIVGSRRMVTWDDLSIQTPVAIYDRGANVACTDTSFGEFLRVATWDGDVRLPKIEATEPLRVQSQYFVDSLRESTQTCSC